MERLSVSRSYEIDQEIDVELVATALLLDVSARLADEQRAPSLATASSGVATDGTTIGLAQL
jgi:hypothetical protein